MIAFLVSMILAATPMQHAHHDAAAAKGMRTPTVAFDADGRAWRVSCEDGHLFTASSSDRGKTWTNGVRVTREEETIDANGESRPKIALGTKGEIYVSWTRSGKKPYTGDIRFARSLDGGKTFSAPRTVNDDRLETGHRFDALAVARDGSVHLAWIDKRDLEAAKAANRTYEGAALYYTLSRDRGATFAANRKLKDNICECCRIAETFDPSGNLVLLWRDATGNMRDHVMIRLTPRGEVQGDVVRATTDHWNINGCPHHGPGAAFGSDGVLHMVWFTGTGPDGAGTFYGRRSASGAPIGESHRLTQLVGAHGVVYASGSRVIAAWKENRTDSGSSIVAAISNDGGRTFAPPRTVAETRGMSDHPFLVPSAGAVYLSWFSATEGHRLIAL